MKKNEREKQSTKLAYKFAHRWRREGGSPKPSGGTRWRGARNTREIYVEEVVRLNDRPAQSKDSPADVREALTRLTTSEASRCKFIPWETAAGKKDDDDNDMRVVRLRKSRATRGESAASPATTRSPD